MSSFRKLFDEIAEEIIKELEGQDKKTKEYDKLQEFLKDKKNQSKKIQNTNQNKQKSIQALPNYQMSSNSNFDRTITQQKDNNLITRSENYQGENSIQGQKSLLEKDRLENANNRRTNSFTDTLYHSKKKNDELKLEKLNEDNSIKVSYKGHSEISKKLRKKNTAREAFISSIIFDRKI